MRTGQINSSYPSSTPTAAYLPPATTHQGTPPVDPSYPAPDDALTPNNYPALVLPTTPASYPSTSVPLLLRRTCANRETWDNTIYQNEVFYYSIFDPSFSYQDGIISYHATINTNFQTSPFNGTNNCSYADSHKIDPYNPS